MIDLTADSACRMSESERGYDALRERILKAIYMATSEGRREASIYYDYVADETHKRFYANLHERGFVCGKTQRGGETHFSVKW